MKLLLFSDLHCQAAAARRVAERAAEVDVLIGAGDFASVRRGIATTIDVLKSIQRPTVLVPGNNETHEELVEACRGWPTAHILHGSGVTIDGVEFFGLGGGVPVTPFGSWSFDLTEDEARALLENCPAGCVLVSHSPPKGTVDVASSGQSLGSVAVLETIQRKRPQLVVCGHIHESGGQTATVGDTVVVNAGSEGIVREVV